MFHWQTLACSKVLNQNKFFELSHIYSYYFMTVVFPKRILSNILTERSNKDTSAVFFIT